MYQTINIKSCTLSEIVVVINVGGHNAVNVVSAVAHVDRLQIFAFAFSLKMSRRVHLGAVLFAYTEIYTGCQSDSVLSINFQF